MLDILEYIQQSH